LLPAFLITLREGFEIALIIGIVFGALRKFKRLDLMSSVWLGVISAAILSLLIAFAIEQVGAELEEPYEQIFEGSMMLLAAGVLTWMIFWMQRQARFLTGKIEAEVRTAVQKTSQKAVFLVAFLAVVREGIELALLFTATAFSMGRLATILGGLTGLAAAVLLGWAIFTATVRLNLQRFFQVTSVLLILFAAGLVAQSVHEFNEIGVIPALIEPIWNTSAALPENSMLGLTLKTLFGYTATPSLTVLLAYLAFFGAIIIGFRYNKQSVTGQLR
jgi:high-affinity iron transporter